MERKLKILKAVLLWRRTNRYQTKEEQIADVEKNVADIDEWIRVLKEPEPETDLEESLDIEQELKYLEEDLEREKQYTPSCTAHDYSPSHPWDAPGMRISDFISI